jgi:DNA-binding transcriptional MocR family regulator
MLTCITTSQFTERLLYLMLVDGHYRKHLSRLRERLGEARVNVVRAFERIGPEMFAEPTDGMFIWARLPNIADSFTLAESAQSEGVVLAPGAVFRPHLERSPWMRFNVATCDDPRIVRWLERQLAKAPNRNIGPSV